MRPYLLRLIKIARKINPGFQKKLCALVGRDRCQGDPTVPSLVSRCIDLWGIDKGNVMSWATGNAALHGDLAKVERLVAADPGSTDRPDEDGDTPIYVAAENGHVEVVQYLAELGGDRVDPDKPINNGYTPIYVAAVNGHVEVVRYLAELGGDRVDPDKPDTQLGATPIYVAAQNGHVEVVRYLAELGGDRVDPDKPINNGYTPYTPIHAAASNGHVEVVRCLAELGGDRVDPDKPDAQYGATPIHVAAQGGHVEVVRYLAELGGDRVNPGQPCFFEGAAAATMAKINHHGTTPIYSAASNGHVEVVRYLAELGDDRVDPDKPDQAGVTPIAAAVVAGHADSVLALLDAGAAVVPGSDTETPLHTAAAQGDHFPALLFRDAGLAGLDRAGGAAGGTPLQAAVAGFTRRSGAVIGALIDHGADLGDVNGAGALSANLHQHGEYELEARFEGEFAWRAANPVTFAALQAARRGDTAALTAAIAAADPAELAAAVLTNPALHTRDTALVAAAGRGHSDAVEFLLTATVTALAGEPGFAADRAAALLAAARHGAHPDFARPGVEGKHAAACIVHLLADAAACPGLDLAAMLVIPDVHGDTALHLMVTSPAFAKLLGVQVAAHPHLADAADRFDRTAYAMAVPACRNAMAEALYFLGRYKLHAGQPEHRSATSLVVRAVDMRPDLGLEAEFEAADRDKNAALDPDEVEALLEGWKIPPGRHSAILTHARSKSGGLTYSDFVELCKEERGITSTQAVVFKFFKEQEHYTREKAAHQDSSFDPASVVSVLSYHDGDDSTFQEALGKHHPGGADLTGYPRAFVMEAADRNLEQIYLSERLDEPAVAENMRQVATALASVHAKGMVHGDLKLKNIVRTVGSDGKSLLELIDFDAAVGFGKFAGAKTSTGVCPPELFDPVLPYSVRKNLPAAASFDVWSFGVVLYTLLAGRALFEVDRNDNVILSRLKYVVQWSEVDRDVALARSGITNQAAKSLLATLLDPAPENRPSMDKVKDADFFKMSAADQEVRRLTAEKKRLEDEGSSRTSSESGDLQAVMAGLADLQNRQIQMQNGQDELQKKADMIFDNTVALGKVAAATQIQLEDTQEVLLRGMFEATGVLVPTSIVILAEKLPEELEHLGVGEQAFGDGQAATEKHSWFGRVTSFFASPTVKTTGAAEKLLNDHDTYLYLVDEVTGEPVVQAPYPLVIKKHSPTTKKWLPYMKFGLKAMQISNGVSSIVGCFVPGASLVRAPDSVVDTVTEAIGKVGGNTSVDDYDTLRNLVDGTTAGEQELNQMRSASLREFERFLAEEDNDPGKTFAGLSRVVWEGGTKAGKVCWTLPGNVGNMDLIIKMQKEKQALQERVVPARVPSPARGACHRQPVE